VARLAGSRPGSARRAALHLIKKREALMTPLAGALQVAIEKNPGFADLRQYRHARILTMCTHTRASPRSSSWLRTVADSGRGTPPMAAYWPLISVLGATVSPSTAGPPGPQPSIGLVSAARIEPAM